MKSMKNKYINTLFLIFVLSINLFAGSKINKPDEFLNNEVTWYDYDQYSADSLFDLYYDYPEFVKEGIKTKKINVNKIRSDNYTLLMFCAKNGSYALDFFKFLLSNGSNVNIYTEEGSALYFACCEKNVEMVKLLIKNGVNVNDKNVEKNSLNAACYYESLEIVKLLVENGANVNSKSCPITDAINLEKTDILEYLIQKGADVNAVDIYGKTALCYAINYGNVSAINILDENKANWKYVNPDGENLLHEYFKGDYMIYALFDENNNCIDPFYKYHKMTLFEYIISKGVDVNKKEKVKGNTPLLILSNCSGLRDSVYLAKLLLENGANPNVKSKEEEIPLVNAIYNVYFVKFLLENGAKIETKINGKDVFTLALSFLGHGYRKADKHLTDTIYYLIEKYPNRKSEITLSHAIFMEDIELIKELLSNYGDINKFDDQRRSIINNAILTQNIEVVKLTLTRNPDLSIKDGYYTYPPLMNAVYYGNEEIVKLLVNAGADLNIQIYDLYDNYYCSPLYLAIGCEWAIEEMTPKYEIVKILVEAGADINLKGGYNGETPIMTALRYSSDKIVKYLISKDADLFIADDNCNSIFDYATGYSYRREELLNSEIEKKYLKKIKRASNELSISDKFDISPYILYILPKDTFVKIIEIGKLEYFSGKYNLFVKVEVIGNTKDIYGSSIKKGSSGWCLLSDLY